MSNNQGEVVITRDIKILVIGRSGSGKTSFISKWVKNEFSETYKATIVSEFSQKIIKNNEKCYRIQLWDLAGQDRNVQIAKNFSKDSQGCLVMAEVNDKVSLEETIKWKNTIDEIETFEDGEKLPCVLLENKVDMLDESKVNDMDELNIFCKNNGFVNCFRTSAKTGYNVNESMDFLIQEIIRRIEAMSSKELNSNRNTVAIDPDKHADIDKLRKKQTGCC